MSRIWKDGNGKLIDIPRRHGMSGQLHAMMADWLAHSRHRPMILEGPAHIEVIHGDCAYCRRAYSGRSTCEGCGAPSPTRERDPLLLATYE